MNQEFLQRLLENSGLDDATFISLTLSPGNHYKRYHIWQKGKRRQIEEPSEPLMRLQRAFLKELADFPLQPACMAKPGMGIKDNAMQHIDARHLLRVDIKGCYQEITLAATGQSISSSFITGTKDLLEMLPICFVENNGRMILPTGAPTSPMLCNIALTPLDFQVASLAHTHNYRYTRYLDDLILSTKAEERRWKMREDVFDLLIEYGLPPNTKKSRWYGGDNDQMRVTGVSITNKQSAPREIKRLTRSRIYSLAKEGKKIDNVTQGYLAHIKDIDLPFYLHMMDYYNQQKALVCQS